jgi:serine/threonine protein phosphatase PrpC
MNLELLDHREPDYSVVGDDVIINRPAFTTAPDMSDQPAASTGAVSTPRLVVRAVLRTDVGLVRSENQDFGTSTTPDEERDSRSHGRLFIVADGMGGHRGGATASRLAGETVKAQFLGSETADIPTALHDSLARANARIYTEAQANPDLRGMGTTTSALAVRGTEAWFAHVGDSRIYLVRGDEIKQLTDDHSLVASMVREGLLTSKEAETHPRRNVLQRSMGVAEDVEIDVRGPFQLREGDTFILCSDGLHGLVREDELKEISKLPIAEAADEFIRRTLERGAPDNVTVIVARAMRTEEKVLDHRFEDTQPMLPGDPSLFDETQRETVIPGGPGTDRVPLDDTLRVRVPSERPMASTGEKSVPPATGSEGSAPAPPPTSEAAVTAPIPALSVEEAAALPAAAPAGAATPPSSTSPATAAAVTGPSPEGASASPDSETRTLMAESPEAETTARVEVPISEVPNEVATARTLEVSKDEATLLAKTLEVPANEPVDPADMIAGAATLPLRPLPAEQHAAALHRSANEEVDVIPAGSGARSGSHSLLKWMVIVVIALSVAGAWLYWTR